MAEKSLPNQFFTDNLAFAEKSNNPRFIDLEGMTFGRLLVLGYAGPRNRETFWYVECSCGAIKAVSAHALRRGAVKSCGCQKLEKFLNRIVTHGHFDGPEYRIFKGAKARCNNPNRDSYPSYGGRGIEFRFTSFKQFLDHIGPRPSKNHTLDRIDNDGHYEIGNVRWATRSDQNRNQRRIVGISIKGKTRLMCEWAKIYDIPLSRISGRIKAGWCAECSVTMPIRGTCIHQFDDSI